MDEPPLLLYDNACGVCHWLVRFVLRNDPAGRFMFAPLASEAGATLLRQHLVNPNADSVVLIAERRAFVRSDAVIEVAGRLGWPWRAMGIAVFLPRSWRDAAYDAFAARRAGISRRFGLACTAPTIEERARFLHGSDRPPDGSAARNWTIP